MSEINEPNYKHYSRLNTILADKAQWLLANFESRDKNISDPDEYNELLKKEMMPAYEVLRSAFNSGMLNFTCDGDPFEYDSAGGTHYNLDIMTLNNVEFCSWASKKYDLPEELAELSTCSGSKDMIKNQKLEAENDHKAPQRQLTEAGSKDDNKIQVAEDADDDEKPRNEHKSRNKSGPKKCTLSMAVERVYLLLQERRQTEVLRPRMRQAFLECFKEMTTEGNGNNDETLLELIKEVRKSKTGKYTIITKDRPNKKNPKKIDEKSGEYDASQVTRFLNSQRTHHPLET